MPSGDTSRYEVALVCENGHVVNSMSRAHPNTNAPYCSECGKPTTSKCGRCNAQIRGVLLDEGVFSLEDDYSPPSYCHECGASYPWTKASIQAAKELADEALGLDDQERTTLKESIDDVVTDNPRTDLGATRIKRIIAKVIAKAGREAGGILREAIIRVAVDTAKGKLQ